MKYLWLIPLFLFIYVVVRFIQLYWFLFHEVEMLFPEDINYIYETSWLENDF